MKISIKTGAITLLAILGISSIALRTMAACNPPSGQTEPTLTIGGSSIVGVGTNVTYTLDGVGTLGGTYKWTYTDGSALTGFTLPSGENDTSSSIQLTTPSLPSSAADDKVVKCTFTPTDNDWAGDCSAEKKVTIIKVNIDGYVYGESGRKIDNMQELNNPANVVASGYLEFKASVEPTCIEDDLYYKWSSTEGTLSGLAEGQGDSFLDVKWDAPDGHKKNGILKLGIKKSGSDSTGCFEIIKLKTIRPYIVRVKFVNDWIIMGNEQQIADGGDPEYDATVPVSHPVCYEKDTDLQVEVDLGGDVNDDRDNNLIKKTKIKVTGKLYYNGAENGNLDEDSIDANTEDWSIPDYNSVDMHTGDNFPDKVTEYEDFKMRWVFKVKNSSGNWVIAYEDGSGCGYSQETEHKDGTYGLYTTFDDYECEELHFTKAHIDDAVSWASSVLGASEHDVAHKVMNEISGTIAADGCICPGGEWSTDWSEECWLAARGDNNDGMCCCRAHGMILALQVLGVGTYSHVYVNERDEPGRILTNPTNEVYCVECDEWCLRGTWGGGIWNKWEGACRSGGSGSTCYAPAGKYEGSYEEIQDEFRPYQWCFGPAGTDCCPGGAGHLPEP